MIDIGLIALAPEETALFLDIDGTLLDLAARPDGVHAPDSLKSDLAKLSARLGGALALVSGRAVSDIDRIFSPLALPASGVHGSQFRPRPSEPMEQLSPRIPEAVRSQVSDIMARYPRTLFEDKGVAIALHWRLAPHFGAAIEAEVAALMEQGHPELSLLRGHSVLEIKCSAVDKGTAVERFLRETPFEGRRPVFIGDDVTDRFAFDVVSRRGGYAFAVSHAMEGTLDWFASPSAVREWLQRMAQTPPMPAVA